jgi:hypothetical protein
MTDRTLQSNEFCGALCHMLAAVLVSGLLLQIGESIVSFIFVLVMNKVTALDQFSRVLPPH